MEIINDYNNNNIFWILKEIDDTYKCIVNTYRISRQLGYSGTMFGNLFENNKCELYVEQTISHYKIINCKLYKDNLQIIAILNIYGDNYYIFENTLCIKNNVFAKIFNKFETLINKNYKYFAYIKLIRINMDNLIKNINKLFKLELSKYNWFLISIYMANINFKYSRCATYLNDLNISLIPPLFYNTGTIGGRLCSHNLRCWTSVIVKYTNLNLYNAVFSHTIKNKNICVVCMQRYGIKCSKLNTHVFDKKISFVSPNKICYNRADSHNEDTVSFKYCNDKIKYHVNNSTNPNIIKLLFLIRKYCKNIFSSIPKCVFINVILCYLLN